MTAWRLLLEHGNTVGLVFDIVGALLITLFGLPPAVDRGGVTYLITEGTDQAEARKATRYERLGRFGLILLVIGFGLQLVASISQRCPR